MHVSSLPFFFLPPSALDLGAALRVVFSLGMMLVGGCMWLLFVVSCWSCCKQRVSERKRSRRMQWMVKSSEAQAQAEASVSACKQRGVWVSG
jgi:hypothetical protein